MLHTTLRVLIQELALLPHANNLRIFGSMITDKASPADIDVGLLAFECETFSEALKHYGMTIRPMLQLARKHYGYLDPFVLCQRQLVVRNDEANEWMNAANVRALKPAIRQGWPIEKVIEARLRTVVAKPGSDCLPAS